jgi:hypothetical protein
MQILWIDHDSSHGRYSGMIMDWGSSGLNRRTKLDSNVARADLLFLLSLPECELDVRMGGKALSQEASQSFAPTQ